MDAAYPHVADRLFGRAHAIEPNAFRALIESPAGKRIISGERSPESSGKDGRKIRKQRLSALIEGEWIKVPGGLGEYFVTSSGVAILPVMGVLSQRFDWLAALCGWTTYEGLSASIEASQQDYRVTARLLDVESPGGECAGMLDAADKILAARSGKPIWAVANSYAASAAYALAGSAERLIVPRLGVVGSIGAVSIHVDQSAYDQSSGLKYTAVFSGARKIDGWAHAPLSRDARASCQESVDYCREQFAQLVGRQGRMSKAAALATEAATYFDQEAVAGKLADAVGTFDDAVSELAAAAAQPPRSGSMAASETIQTGEHAMTTKKEIEPVLASAATAVPAAAAAQPDAASATLVSAADPSTLPRTVEIVETVAVLPAAALTDIQLLPGTQSQPPAAAPAYGEAEIMATLDLCTIAGAAGKAREFISAKTPIANVREQLLALKASADARSQVDPVAAEGPAHAAIWDRAHAQVRKENAGPQRKSA